MEIVNDGWPVAVNPITERNPSRPSCILQRVCLNVSAVLKVWGLCQPILQLQGLFILHDCKIT